MRKTLLALMFSVLPGTSFAAPCIPDLLSNYLALGASGCSVGDALFSDFVPLPGGLATPIPADEILVTPLATPGNPGLRFDVDVEAGAGDVLQALFGYRASGTTFIGNRLSIAGTQVEPDGAVTAVETKCLGGIFTAGQAGCTGSEIALIVFDIGIDAELEALLAFGAVSVVGIVNDLVIDGGIGGRGALGSATNQFTTASTVPEPATLALLTLGGVLGMLKRHRAKD